jgi:NNP family nitrate/nitrite transporter-like MFS transporter
MGGWLSDRFTSRKTTLLVLTIGLCGGYILMGLMGGGWPIMIAVGVTMLASYFVQAGEGAVFAIVPLVKNRITGQVAGMAGAYGNVGAVTFLTLFAVIGDPHTFFFIIAGAAGLGVVGCLLLAEPKGSHGEEYHDEHESADGATGASTRHAAVAGA